MLEIKTCPSQTNSQSFFLTDSHKNKSTPHQVGWWSLDQSNLPDSFKDSPGSGSGFGPESVPFWFRWFKVTFIFISFSVKYKILDYHTIPDIIYSSSFPYIFSYVYIFNSTKK